MISSFTITQAKARRNRGRCEVAMDRRLFTVALVPLLALAGTAAAVLVEPASWATPQIRAVAAAGLMDAKDVASFRAGRPADRAVAREPRVRPQAAAAPPLPVEPPPVVPAVPTDPTSRPPTVTDPTADAGDDHRRVDHTVHDRSAARAGCLPATPKQLANPDQPVTMCAARPPPRAVARARRRPRTSSRPARARPGSRFRAASAPRSLPACSGCGSTTRRARTRSSSCRRIPPRARKRRTRPRRSSSFTARRPRRSRPRRLLRAAGSSRTGRSRSSTTAFARVGMPYIWGGTSDRPETEFGVTSRGGYDCSGFVWRVYKLADLYPAKATSPRCFAAGRRSR